MRATAQEINTLESKKHSPTAMTETIIKDFVAANQDLEKLRDLIEWGFEIIVDVERERMARLARHMGGDARICEAIRRKDTIS